MTMSEAAVPPEYGAHPEHDHDALAAVFRALAEPARLQIVHRLEAGEQRVTDLAAAIGLAQSTTSAHLATLRAAGLVAARSEGRSSYYSLTTPALVALVQHAEHLLDHGLHVVVHAHDDAAHDYAAEPARTAPAPAAAPDTGTRT